MPTMGRQNKSAASGADATLHDNLLAADMTVRENPAVVGVANSVNTNFLEKLSFVDDRLVATLDLGAGGSFEQILERFEFNLNANRGLANSQLARTVGSKELGEATWLVDYRCRIVMLLVLVNQIN
jgi:putative ATP-dependent endonuclease of OLD family